MGLASVVEGGAFVSAADGVSSGAAAGLLLGAGGALLLAGFLTPLVALVISVCATGLALAWFPTPTPDVFAEGLTAVFVATVAFAIVLLGPGAYSLDSYLFGRREIVISARPRV